jgi:hypothetical protein
VNTHVSRPRTPAGALTLAAVVVLFVVVPTAAATRGLGLVQIAGGQGCIAQPDEESTALTGCGRGRGLIDANDIALSADGKSLYVAPQVQARCRRSPATVRPGGSRRSTA